MLEVTFRTSETPGAPENLRWKAIVYLSEKIRWGTKVLDVGAGELFGYGSCRASAESSLRVVLNDLLASKAIQEKAKEPSYER